MTSFANLNYGYTNNQQQQNNPELTVSAVDYSLLTDLYQLTMTACYTGEGLEQRRASFELFVRRLPDNFGYLIAMGLAQALEYLEKFRFSPDGIEALQATGIFANAPESFWSLLAEGRFTGDVWALPEGTAVFANEPLLRVEAPLWQAQLVETYLLNTLNYQSLIATRAARLRDAASVGTTLLEFGTRRAFSPQASLWAARAALAGGLDATSNVLAALQLGEKPSGTMAHAFVMALSAMEGSEDQAFTVFHQYFPGAPLLIDTYDTIAAAQRLAAKVNSGEMKLSGVRLDSGDLVSLSKQVRSLLPNVSIIASGDLDEWEIARLVAAGAQIDGYGLGTRLVTGSAINGVYKLVEIDGIPVMKHSSGKATYPGRKQIFRLFEGGKVKADSLDLAAQEQTEETTDKNGKFLQSSEVPLLQLFLKEGKRVQPVETLAEIRQRTATSVASLPDETRRLDNPVSVQVDISTELRKLTQDTQKRTAPSAENLM